MSLSSSIHMNESIINLQNMRKLLIVLLMSLGLLHAYAEGEIDGETYYRVTKVKDSVNLFNGNLRLINIYKQQIAVLYETRNLTEQQVRAELIKRTYLPYQEFWEGYVDDSTVYYEQVMKPLIKDSIRIMAKKALTFSSFNIDNFFNLTASVLKCYSGRTPSGTWFIAFGSGVTDMGGFGNGRMVLDLTHSKAEIGYVQMILPHEINHQIYENTILPDTTARGLYRAINEGFAVYMNQVVFGDKYEMHEYLQYSVSGLQYCLDNEKAIFSKLKPYLFTNNREHALALADRGQKPFKEGPGAIGYFVGFRICEAYVKKHGKESWKDIYSLSPREVLLKSGYGE